MRDKGIIKADLCVSFSFQISYDYQEKGRKVGTEFHIPRLRKDLNLIVEIINNERGDDMCSLYKYDGEKKLYSFNGDLEEFLIKQGVSKCHINKMKKKVLESSRKAYQINLDIISCRLVPLDKVIGTSRCTPGWSVFDNVNKMAPSDREPYRFTDCLNYLSKMSLKELRESYEVLPDPVRMAYYKDDDAYYLEGDGNHRTLTAMLIGAKNIRARVKEFKCDYAKKEKVCAEKEFRKKHKIVEIRKYLLDNVYEMIFFDNYGQYVVGFFEGKKDNESVLDLIDRLSNTIKSDKRKIELLDKHAILCKIMLCYLRKRDFKCYSRLKKYIKKEYLESHENRPLNKEEKIWLKIRLYDL